MYCNGVTVNRIIHLSEQKEERKEGRKKKEEASCDPRRLLCVMSSRYHTPHTIITFLQQSLQYYSTTLPLIDTSSEAKQRQQSTINDIETEYSTISFAYNTFVLLGRYVVCCLLLFYSFTTCTRLSSSCNSSITVLATTFTDTYR